MSDPQTYDSPAIDLQGVAKTYGGGIRALGGVDIRVNRGEIFGLLGPNGAGKSTLVKIMMTVVRPDRASGTILGNQIGHRRTFERIGYLPEDHRLPHYLRGEGLLRYYAALARVPRRLRRKRARYWLERVGMSEWGGTKIGKYSKGMLQRLGLAQALMNDPELVILDEPTDGVDPLGRRQIRELLLELKNAGKTVFLNSHLLSELEMVCDRVAILISGQVARQGTLDELTAHAATYQIRVASEAGHLRDRIAELGGRLDGRTINAASRDGSAVNALIDLLRANDVLIEAVEPRRPSLEDIFVEVVGREATGSGPAVRADVIPKARPAGGA